MIKASTQAHLDAALAADPDAEIELATGSFTLTIEAGTPRLLVRTGSRLSLTVRGSARPIVVARDDARPIVYAYDDARPIVVARDDARPIVYASGSAQPIVYASGSARPIVEARSRRCSAWARRPVAPPSVEAWNDVRLSVSGAVTVKAAPSVSVLIDGPAQVEGGKQTMVSRQTPEGWCAFYGVSVEDGIATLYKALNEDYTSPRGMSYAPGTIPVAPDWDGGKAECGGGLHFSPSPWMAASFHSDATRYAASPVALSDIAVHPNGNYPEKVKARACCGPIVECDENGEPTAK